MKKVLILRGVPGAGKSTYAKTIPGATIVSADDYFMKSDGTYAYNRDLIQKAHEFCFREFLAAAEADKPTIIVDNTNVQAWEISPYYLSGKALAMKWRFSIFKSIPLWLL
jgi:predicted kinase